MKPIIIFFLLGYLSTSYSQAPGNGLTDIDGTVYNSVILDTQEWQKENLKVSKYSDGTIIPYVTDPLVWANLTTGAWTHYQNDSSLEPVFGKYYNHFAVEGKHDNDPNTPNKSLAPNDWHIPTTAEWDQLITFLGGSAVAGGAMKTVGSGFFQSPYWNSPNANATNSSNFSGLPGGYRGSTSLGTGMYGNGLWWVAENIDQFGANYIFLSYLDGSANAYGLDTRTGISVRVLKNPNSDLNSNYFEEIACRVFPNPTNRYLNIKSKTGLIGSNYSIYNTLGKSVLTGKIASENEIIDLDNLSNGLYLLKLDKNTKQTFKIIKN